MLVLGPLLRYVDHDSASVWVETAERATVRVEADDRRWSASTFAVHGHHYALVEVTGLEAGTVTPYAVVVETSSGEHRVWPAEDAGLDLPPPVISTLHRDRPPRLSFGSCRTSVGHDREGNAAYGVDALRAYALAMAGEQLRWPDLVVFLGDQVYADDTSEAMREFIASRRDPREPPGSELQDFEEYAHLYALAWSEPANRWLLSTLPSAMIFDDHDIRDDWNTSHEWRQEMRRTSWWQGRIVAGLASYWVYQHLGNLSATDRADDEIWRIVVAHEGPDELDLSSVLDEFAARVDEHPDTYRWSHARDLGGSRLVVVDSRAARVLASDTRQMLDDVELAWLDEQVTGDVDHLFLGTSLPFLLPPGLQHLEAFDEAVAQGAWGPRAARAGERLRQVADLEHWGAFQDSFRAVARMVTEAASGRRGRAPHTITFLSGDVHHSYVSEVTRVAGLAEGELRSRILQVVCSPIRNPLPRAMRLTTTALSRGVASSLGRGLARAAGVPAPPWRWTRVRGPWFDNNLATVEITDTGLRLHWARGTVRDGREDRPELETVCEVLVRHRPPGTVGP